MNNHILKAEWSVCKECNSMRGCVELELIIIVEWALIRNYELAQVMLKLKSWTNFQDHHLMWDNTIFVFCIRVHWMPFMVNSVCLFALISRSFASLSFAHFAYIAIAPHYLLCPSLPLPLHHISALLISIFAVFTFNILVLANRNINENSGRVAPTNFLHSLTERQTAIRVLRCSVRVTIYK